MEHPTYWHIAAELVRAMQQIGGSGALAVLALLIGDPFHDIIMVFGRRLKIEVFTHPKRGIWIEPVDN